MKKSLPLYRAAIVLASALIGVAGAASAANAGGNGNHGGGDGGYGHCDSTPSYDHHLDIKNGVATATVSVARGTKLCSPQDVTLVSYFAPRPQFATPQYLFESKTATLTNDQPTAVITVNVPDCNTQVDLFKGGDKDVINPIVDKGSLYGDKKLDWFNGGTQNCVQPAVQSVENCDGSVDLQLSNNGVVPGKPSGYPVDFKISYGGQTRTVTVESGKGATYTVPAGSGQITVSADRLTTETISWTRPATCVPAATAANDCKTVTVTVTNPEHNIEVKAEVTYGTEKKSVTVAAGTSADVSFTAGTATSATVAFPDLGDVQPLNVAVVSGECASTPPTTVPATPTESASASPSVSPSASTTPATATPSAAPSTTPVSNGGSLPLTGAAGGTIAGGAALLLIIGGVLFFLARRRKVNFTA
jgi:LPXTG-motif cell wall-anchored protein